MGILCLNVRLTHNGSDHVYYDIYPENKRFYIEINSRFIPSRMTADVNYGQENADIHMCLYM